MSNLKKQAFYYITLCVVFAIISLSVLFVGFVFYMPSIEVLAGITFFWTLGCLASIMFAVEAKETIKKI